MEIACTIIVLIALIILGWYQRGQMKLLETDLASHQRVLDCLKVYLDIFDPEQLQAWVKTRQETAEQQDDLEIERMRSWMEGLMQERFEGGKWIERETSAATDLMIRLLFYAPPHLRRKSVEKMPNSMFKDAFKKVLDRMPEHDQIFALGGIECASTTSRVGEP